MSTQKYIGRRAPVLDYNSINELIKKCRYDVRGELYLAAVKRANEGKEVIYTNVGNPHALGQVPLTFGRQVLALLMAPFLLDDPRVASTFPPDVITRARTYLSNIKGGLGAYSDSRGNPYVRGEVAAFIERQGPGIKVNIDNIFVSNGASECVRMFLNTIIRNSSDGIMVPIPQYPLYSAAIGLYGGELCPYYLDEDAGWALNMAELQRSIDESRAKKINVRALVFINPGNPTGQCLSADNIRDLLTFCYENRLVLMADEVSSRLYDFTQFEYTIRLIAPSFIFLLFVHLFFIFCLIFRFTKRIFTTLAGLSSQRELLWPKWESPTTPALSF